MKMKKTMTFLAAVLMSMGSMMADEVSVGNVTIPQGGVATVSVSLSNPNKEYTAGQMVMVLPEGVTAVLKENGDPTTEKGSRLHGTSHSIGASHLDDGTDQYTIFSISSEAIPGTDGPLFTVTVTADADLAVGTSLEGTLKNIEMTTTDATPTPFNDQTFTITIGEPADSHILIDENATVMPEAATNVDVRVRRTLNANEWTTICLPFAMTEEQAKAAFGEGVEIADFTSWSSTEDDNGDITAITVKFESVTAMEANHPYIIKVVEDVTEFTLDGVNVEPSDEPTVQVGKKKAERGYLTGTYVVANVPEESLVFTSGLFIYSDGTMQVNALSAYFEFADVLENTDEAASRIIRTSDGITTGVGATLTNSREVNGSIYDLQGRRINNQMKKGIYIKNGNKAIIR